MILLWPGLTKCCTGLARRQYLALIKGWRCCCSCRRYEMSSLRRAALRQSAASRGGRRQGVEQASAASAFTVYCRCTNTQRRIPVTSSHVPSFIPPAAAAELVFTRWRYWSLVQLAQNSTWLYYHLHLHRQQQKRLHSQQQLISKPPSRLVYGAPVSVSMTSARRFSCPSCSYSTDRKNNLVRHVTTMHRRLAVTSSGGIYGNGEPVRKVSSSKRLRAANRPLVPDVACAPRPRHDGKTFISP